MRSINSYGWVQAHMCVCVCTCVVSVAQSVHWPACLCEVFNTKNKKEKRTDENVSSLGKTLPYFGHCGVHIYKCIHTHLYIFVYFKGSAQKRFPAQVYFIFVPLHECIKAKVGRNNGVPVFISHECTYVRVFFLEAWFSIMQHFFDSCHLIYCFAIS